MVVSELFHAAKRLLTDCPWLAEAKFFDKVDSTQKRILQFLPKEDDKGVVILAETQSKGFGRQGRTWLSPAGGIWMTLALPMKGRELSQVASFSVAAALIVVQSLKEVNNLEVQLKWPNDVQHKGKKLAGILCNTTKKFKKGWFLVGIGINVNNDLPAAIAKEATSIKAVRGQSQGRSRLVEAVLDGLWKAWEDYDHTGFGPYQKGVERCLTGVGETARILVGNKTVQGPLVGIDPQGGLLLKSASGTQTINAGEVVGDPA